MPTFQFASGRGYGIVIVSYVGLVPSVDRFYSRTIGSWIVKHSGGFRSKSGEDKFFLACM